MTVDNTLKFLMDTLKNSKVLLDMIDNKISTEIPRVDATLNGEHKTIVGVSIVSESQQSYFMSQILGYIRSEAIAQVVVITGNGSTDQYCRNVVKQIRDIFQDAQYIGTYRIFINSIKDDVKSSGQQGRWTGTLSIEILRFDPITT